MRDPESPISTVIRECFERHLAFWLFNHPEVVLRGGSIEGGRVRWSISPTTNLNQTLAESYSSPFIAIGRYKELLEFGRQPEAPQGRGTMSPASMADAKMWPAQPKDVKYKRLADGTDWKWEQDREVWVDITYIRQRLSARARR